MTTRTEELIEKEYDFIDDNSILCSYLNRTEEENDKIIEKIINYINNEPFATKNILGIFLAFSLKNKSKTLEQKLLPIMSKDSLYYSLFHIVNFEIKLSIFKKFYKFHNLDLSKNKNELFIHCCRYTNNDIFNYLLKSRKTNISDQNNKGFINAINYSSIKANAIYNSRKFNININQKEVFFALSQQKNTTFLKNFLDKTKINPNIQYNKALYLASKDVQTDNIKLLLTYPSVVDKINLYKNRVLNIQFQYLARYNNNQQSRMTDSFNNIIEMVMEKSNLHKKHLNNNYLRLKSLSNNNKTQLNKIIINNKLNQF